MELTLTKINGTNPFLNYDELKDSFINELISYYGKAEVIILNKFPVSVLNQSTLDFVIFIKVPENLSVRPKIETKDNFVYISNLIIAVSIIKEYKNQNITVENSELEINDSFIDLKDNASKLKWGLTNYFHDACNLIREKITVHPVFWVLNDNDELVSNNIIVAKSLKFNLIKECIALNDYLRYPGYLDWNYEPSYETSIKQILERASKDSELGYLTKQKIERFQNRFESASQKAFDSIGNTLVEVKGRAGSGKSSDLLKWMLQKSLIGKRATFLTYNHLLVYEISRQIKGFENVLTENEIIQKESTTTNTIHSFMFNIAKKLGVVLLMSESRISYLTNVMNDRLERIELLFNGIRNQNITINKNDLKKIIQNENSFDEGTKREAIDFINHSDMYKDFKNVLETKKHINQFKIFKKIKLEEHINSSMFLSDYHEVLKKILLAIDNLDLFFKEFQIENKFELLENTMNLNSSILVNDGSKNINLEELKKRYGKSINGFRAGRSLYIDEAQDCHSYERDIFFSLFGVKNIIIASGGKEQLIRYSEVCNWNISKGYKIDSYQYLKRRKSYRMKPAIASLVNHIAASFNIDLGIEPLDTEDHGRILIERNYNPDLFRKAKIINELLIAGTRQGCSSYDSLLLLKNAKEKNQNANIILSDQKSININEYDVVKIDSDNKKTEWELLSIADNVINEARFWNSTGNIDKRKQSVPGSLSIRAIYYESSRGLEAWSTMCFDINGFFDSKRNEDDADNFLLSEIMEPEERKNKYAATWVLMALTRAIDTCYIELLPSDNALNNSINSFINMNHNYIEMI
ncbi:hypothetical protein [Flavobacterium psychrotolerans]|uniref:DNA helicase n=1 Tax=Flavobacterium psychrotolerans TaxID=2169410 RepID=A0A2U1JQ22_9FLAO|nr:hypothetical protein [Flavobacterium psychrotolerans]PWA07276.1 hypothetical protein DB895_00700 [Flavobacterium psychrotolerans]